MKFKKPAALITAVSSLFVLLFYVTEFAFASNPNEIRACADKKSGAMRYLASGSCRTSEVSLSWSKLSPVTTVTTTTSVTTTSTTTTSTTVPTPQYQVGDRGPAGGYIFYVDTHNLYTFTYLEAAPSDVNNPPNYLRWCDNQPFPSGTYTSSILGEGLANTALLLGSCYGEFNQSYIPSGSNNWYVPTREEISLLRFNLANLGITILREERYCTSSVRSSDGYGYSMDTRWNSQFARADYQECLFRLIRKF